MEAVGDASRAALGRRRRESGAGGRRLRAGTRAEGGASWKEEGLAPAQSLPVPTEAVRTALTGPTPTRFPRPRALVGGVGTTSRRPRLLVVTDLGQNCPPQLQGPQ